MSSKAARRRAKKQRAEASIYDVPPVSAREDSGRKSRAGTPRAADALALAVRCKRRGVTPTDKTMRDSRAQWWGCNAGTAMAAEVGDEADRIALWGAIQHMRRTVAAYDRAIGAPHRHAVCLRLLAPQEAMEADASDPAPDPRDDEARTRAAVTAWTQLHGWLAYVPPSAAAEAWRVVVDDARPRDVPGMIAALRCVHEGRTKGRVTYRGRDAPAA
ncbi:hypothetical protein [Paracoccus sp. (in: a-proteobacteria)]|uniref:hypothetical protein n=1 Tax=Paracoccus sp. TaxID=267 RepID=UPI0032200449